MPARPQPLVLLQYGGFGGRSTFSPPCAKVQMALRRKGLDYEVRNARSPGEVRRLNPRGRVPVLLLDGETVADSSDILTVLDERWPEPRLEPPDPRDRLLDRLWEDWGDEVLYFQGVYLRWLVPEHYENLRAVLGRGLRPPLRWLLPRLGRSMARRRLQGQGTGEKPREVVEREFQESLHLLEGWLQDRPFLTDTEPRRGDLAVCAVLDQLALDLHPGTAARILEQAALCAWRERVHALTGNPALSDRSGP